MAEYRTHTHDRRPAAQARAFQQLRGRDMTPLYPLDSREPYFYQRADPVATAAFEGMPQRSIDINLAPELNTARMALDMQRLSRSSVAIMPLASVVQPRPGLHPGLFKRAPERTYFNRPYVESAERHAAYVATKPVRAFAPRFDTRLRP